MNQLPTIRIFISSPSDVRPERLRAEAIVRRLSSEFAYHFAVEPLLWEREPLVASHHFQHEDNIPQPHRADIVVVILWTRLGVPLPADQFVGALSGAAVTGTEWEFEDALAGARASGTPDLLLYRKDAPPTVDLTDRQAVQDRLAQLDLVEGFVGRWFRSADGKGFTAAMHGFNTATQFEEKLYDHLRALLERRAGAAAEGSEIRWHGPPFRGLAPFEQAHAAVFFGRTRARNELRDVLARRELRGPAFLLVLGASGSGKSSLVKAGLLPDLMLPGMIGRVALVRQAALRPSNRPHDLVGDLAAALLAPDALPELATLRYTPERLADLLRRAPDQAALPVEQGLAEAARAAALPALSEARLVLVVDQLEELFTVEALDPAERLAFVTALDALARTGMVWVVATMRSDFFDRLEQVPALARLADGEACYRLLPPDAGELAQIIRQPARAAGLRFAFDPQTGTTLDEVILQAAARDRGALPLLSFLLDQLWQNRTDRGEMTFETYVGLGGLEGALGRHAETVFAAQPEPVQLSLPALLRAVVTVSPGVQAGVAARTARLDRFPDGSPARALLDAFLHPAARLLVADEAEGGTPRIRVAHEALLTHWPRARDWIDERPADLQLEDRIEAEAARWAEADPADRPSLLRAAGLPLSEAQDLLARRRDELSDTAATYIEASLAQDAARQDAERARAAAEQALRREAAEAEAARQRQVAEGARRVAARTRAGLLVACALLLVAGGLAWLSVERTGEARAATQQALAATRTAEGRLADAQLNASRFVAERADQELRAGRPELASILARTALPTDLAHPDRPVWYPAASVIGAARSLDARALDVLPHRDSVLAVAISPDGQRAATSSRDGTAKLWDVATGRLIQVLAGHTNWILTVAFSPDGTRLVTASFDGTARIWDGRSGRPLTVLTGHTQGLWAAAFSPDGKLVATTSSDLTARVWDAATGATVSTVRGHTSYVQAVAWSPDGKRIVTGAMDQTARTWDAATGAQLLLLQHEAAVGVVAWSPDGDSILTASRANAAKLWDAESGELEESFEHTDMVFAAAFSPDGAMVATGSRDGTARLWETETGKALQTLRGHTGGVTSIGFAGDGKTLVTGSADFSARLWNAAGQPLAVFQGHSGSIAAASLSPDGRRVVTASYDGTGRIWDATPSARTTMTIDPAFTVSAAVWSPDGTRVATASGDNRVRVWDARTGALAATASGHSKEIDGLSWSPDGTRLLTASYDATARIWDAATGAQLFLLSGHTSVLTSARFSPDGRRVLTAAFNDPIRLWDAQSGELLQRITPISAVTDTRFSPDGERFAAATFDHDVPVWDSRTGQLVARLQGHTDTVKTLDWSPDGRRLVTGSVDRTARVWDVAAQTQLGRLDSPTGQVYQVTWSPDGRRIAVDDGDARLWSADSFTLLGSPHGRNPAFSPDGQYLLTVSPEGLWVFDVATGAVVARYGTGPEGGGSPAAWSPDSRSLFGVGEAREGRVWDVWPLLTRDTVRYADLAALRQLTKSERASVFLETPAGTPPADAAAECDRLAADATDPHHTEPGVAFDGIVGETAVKACTAAVAANPAQQRFRYQLGRALQRAGDQAAAGEAYRVAADGGYAPATYALGIQAQYGAKPDTDRAVALYRQADAAGFAPGTVAVGLAYLNGWGVTPDRAEAMRWLERAASAGDPNANGNLGALEEAGAGMPTDLEAALRHYGLAVRLSRRLGAVDEFGNIYRAGAIARRLDPVVVARIAGEVAAWQPEPLAAARAGGSGR